MFNKYDNSSDEPTALHGTIKTTSFDSVVVSLIQTLSGRKLHTGHLMAQISNLFIVPSIKAAGNAIQSFFHDFREVQGSDFGLGSWTVSSGWCQLVNGCIMKSTRV